MSKQGIVTPTKSQASNSCYPWQRVESYDFDDDGLTLVRQMPYWNLPYESIREAGVETGASVGTERLRLLSSTLGCAGVPGELRKAYAEFFDIPQQYLDRTIV